MSNVVRLLPEADRAFAAFQDAREVAMRSGRRDDADRAGRLFAVLMDTYLPKECRWPREPQTLRLLTPSELTGGHR